MKLRTQNKVERTILTTEGKITYSRYSLIPADKESADILWKSEHVKAIYPLDCAFHIDRLPFKVTPDLMLEVAWYNVNAKSYQHAEDVMSHAYENLSSRTFRGTEHKDEDDSHTKENDCSTSRGKEEESASGNAASIPFMMINDDSIREISNYIGKIVYMEDCRLAREAKWRIENGKIHFSSDENDVLYLMMDGAAINTIHHVNKRDPTDSSWRENKLCVAFRSKDIVTFKTVDEKGQEYIKRVINRKEYISYAGTVEEFKWHVLALALKNGYEKVKTVVIVADGASWIWNMQDELFHSAVPILDLFHLKENVYEYAKALWNNDEAKYKPWAAKLCKRLENGEWEGVLKTLEQHKNKKLTGNTVDLYGYIKNHKNMLDYPSFKAKGFIIGSGMIESGNKTVLQDRLKRAGQRWNIVTARYILALTAKSESGLWESYVVPLVIHAMNSPVVPAKLPRSKKEIEALEKEEIATAIQREKKEWEDKYRYKRSWCKKTVS